MMTERERVTRHRASIWQGASKEWITSQILVNDSKLEELRCAVGWLNSRIEFFEHHRQDLIVFLDDPKAYCGNCRGRLVEGYDHRCPVSKIQRLPCPDCKADNCARWLGSAEKCGPCISVPHFEG